MSSWPRIIFRYVTLALVTLAPLLTSGWSFLNQYLGRAIPPGETVELFNGRPWALSGPKDQLEFKLRVAVSVIVIGLTWLIEATDVARPLLRVRRFREKFLSGKRTEWEQELSEDIRVNVMFVRRPWYLLGAGRVFRWVWSCGFDPPHAHHDANLHLFAWQGLCGRALRTGEPQLALLNGKPFTFAQKWLFQNEFHLSPRQLRKVKRLKCILSVPVMLESGGGAPKHRPVGVINLDTQTEAGARLLEQNSVKLGDYFTRIGKVLAELR